MLSVILYGRNDDHGYNYHKRLAISLNCLAQILTDDRDEIIFVDYNTPNELPTIIEAIQDILTTKTKSFLRILRVRPFYHQSFAKQTALPVIEPLARNVAIRRTRPHNKWILSTNIDMIFVPEEGDSLTQIVSDLKDGYYCLPRFEIPENLWELSFERMHPEKNLALLKRHSQALNLNTVVRKEGCIQYDNPGDFQLMLRKDLIDMGGFDERMIKGWHVDSNLCKRMDLLGRSGQCIEKFLKGYHCNHTHKESFLHSQSRTQNDWYQFVESPSLVPILNQPNWGLADQDIEEVSLSNSHLNSMLDVLKEEVKSSNKEFLVSPELYNCLTYSPSRVFVYLADHLCNLPFNSNIVYIGYNSEMISKIGAYLTNRDFKGKLLYEDSADVSLYIFDFGFDENSVSGQAVSSSKEGYIVERKKIKNVLGKFFQILKKRKNQDAKVLGINVNYTDFGVIFNHHLSVRLTSYITGIAYGYFSNQRRSRRNKKNTIKLLRYWIARYLFKYSDPIRRLILRVVKNR